MGKEKIKKRLEELYNIVEGHNYRYYVLDDPIIEDSEYDALMREIKELEAENPEIVSPNSPTRRVGGYAVTTFEILSVEQETDFYYTGKGVQSRENPYQVGNTIQVIEWYGFAPSQSNAEKFVLYRSYPYPVRGIEMPDPAELGGIYRLSLIDGSALAEQDNIVAANCYDTAGGAEFSRSGVLYLAGVYLIADLEKAE